MTYIYFISSVIFIVRPSKFLIRILLQPSGAGGRSHAGRQGRRRLEDLVPGPLRYYYYDDMIIIIIIIIIIILLLLLLLLLLIILSLLLVGGFNIIIVFSMCYIIVIGINILIRTSSASRRAPIRSRGTG